MKNFVTKKLAEISDKDKKKYLLLPLLIAVGLIFLIFSFNSSSKGKKSVVNNPVKTEENLTMPVPKKINLSNDKSNVSEELSRENRKIENESKNDFFSVYDEKANESLNEENLMKNDDPYNKGDQELINKVQQQLAEIEKQKTINTKTVAVKKQRTYRPEYKTTAKTTVKEENTINPQDFFTKKLKEEEKPATNIVNISRTDPIIYAVIHHDQQITTDGQRVTLRLTKAATINDKIYKKNTFIYGFIKYGKNRMFLNIHNIDNMAVNLIGYDKQDGYKGLYIDNITSLQELENEGSNETINDQDLRKIPLGKTVKALLKKKSKLKKVYLLNNYELLLKSQP